MTDDVSDAIKNCRSGLLIISRGTAILLLAVYAAYLRFQLSTHAFLFKPKNRRRSQGARPIEGGEASDDEEAGEGARGEEENEEEEKLEMAPLIAGAALLLVTVITSFAADYRE